MVSDDNLHVRLLLLDRTYQGMVRSELRRMAESVGFTGHRLGEIEIIIAEITSNLVKHTTKGGFILAKKITGDFPGIEFISIDNGPGMRVASSMLEDGRSTSKTLGHGLGAIKRLSGIFDLFSMAGWGTILFSRTFIDKKYIAGQTGLELSAISLAKKEQLVCGDAWSVRTEGKKLKIAMADGLGHGSPAHLASSLAMEKLQQYKKLDPKEELSNLHPELKKTRGAVITIAHVDLVNRQLSYSGVGNISMKMISPVGSKGFSSYNGIVGHIMPSSLNTHHIAWNDKTDTLVMHSDGISARWDIMKYPGIGQHRGIILCAALFKDFDRGNDDSTILTGKIVQKIEERD